MTTDTPQYQYSVIEYLNEATVLLRMKTAQVLPKWMQDVPNVRDVTALCAKRVGEIANRSAMVLEEKISLTAGGNEGWGFETYNRMSGLFNKVRDQVMEDPEMGTVRRASEMIKEYDQKITSLANDAHELKKLVQGVADQQLKESVPQDVTDVIAEMHTYNEAARSTFWSLLDVKGSWNNDRERIRILNRLGTLNNYPQVAVLWARFIRPQVEEIEREASAICREVQLRRGTWQQISNDLRNVAYLLGSDAQRMSWYNDPFSIVAKTQLRIMKDIAARCAQ